LDTDNDVSIDEEDADDTMSYFAKLANED